ncbi:MAG: hypothetical protein J0L81_05630 [Caulobacterales bacterium]|jgi:hypothetical protein|nr:hypothetical protein [Caulobacterales bacterium]
MSRLVASALATAISLAMLAGATMPSQAPASAAMTPAAVSAPIAQPQLGQCQIQYDALPDTHQPAPMECEHAHWLARTWGGRVMENTGEALIERAAYDGRNDFSGVPASALPRRGYCRAWIDGRAPEAQPLENDCVVARREAAALGGRVIFMPL